MPEDQIPATPRQPDGSVRFFDDPKIRAVLQTVIAPIVVGALLRWLKIKSDPEMIGTLSTWLVSTIIPGLVGGALGARAIYRRIKAGQDPSNPAPPITSPAPKVAETIARITRGG
jgi:hypothetical protein